MIIGATAEGKKELVGLADGIRAERAVLEELLLDLKRRGLTIDPQLAIADGALGFWKAIDEVWPKTRAQRCWVLSSEPKCNTPADLIIGTVDQDLRECCHAMLFAFVG